MDLPLQTRNSLNFFAGFLQNFQGHIDLPLADIEGWQKTDGLVATAKEKQAFLEAAGDDPVSPFPGIDLHRVHEADSAHVVNKGIMPLQVP
jgi:hypothetical protein